MKHLALTAALAVVALLGINAQSNALSPQSISAQTRTQSMSFGTTETVNITLHDAQNSYTIPAGKVLHIEHLFWALESDATHQSIAIVPGNEVPAVGDNLLKFTVGSEDMYSPVRPIRVLGDGNAKVLLLNNSVVDWRDVVIIGYLTNA